MKMIKPRTKLVSFRLSEEEYERVQDACAAERARSLSEFARGLLLQRTIGMEDDKRPTAGPFGENTQELLEAMQQLNQQLRQLVSVVQSSGWHS
jgi:hypothetical protein